MPWSRRDFRPHHVPIPRHSILLVCGCLLTIGILLAQPATAHAAEAKEFVLANGLKVLILEVQKAPVVTVQVWYRVGSRNEVMEMLDVLLIHLCWMLTTIIVPYIFRLPATLFLNRSHSLMEPTPTL